MSPLKSWASEKPDVGRMFLVYGRWDAEPTLCEMTDKGPEQSMFNLCIWYSSYDGGGGDIGSELDLQYGALWCYVPGLPSDSEFAESEAASE